MGRDLLLGQTYDLGYIHATGVIWAPQNAYDAFRRSVERFQHSWFQRWDRLWKRPIRRAFLDGLSTFERNQISGGVIYWEETPILKPHKQVWQQLALNTGIMVGEQYAR